MDAGDELVCPGCGVVSEKQVIDEGIQREPTAIDFTGMALGSYLGPVGLGGKAKRRMGFPGSASTYGYLKTISDFVGRERGGIYPCVRTIERVAEKLGLPGVVLPQAANIAKKILTGPRPRRRFTLAAASAFSLISACKIEGVTSVSLRDILDAHESLGKHVKVSSLIQLQLESTVKAGPRKPQEYVARTLARLGGMDHLSLDLPNSEAGRTAYFNSLREISIQVLMSADGSLMAGRRPCALAASAVYAAEFLLAKREARSRTFTQKDVAACGDTAEYTVREQFREIFMPALSTVRVREQPAQPLIAR